MTTSGNASQVFKFKYKPLDDEGNETGVFSKKGSFDEANLILDGETFPADGLIRADRHLNRLMILATKGDQLSQIMIAVTGGNPLRLRDRINRIASQWVAYRKQEELNAQGRVHELTIFDCPHCGSTVELTGFAPTQQRYCYYCDTIFVPDHPVAKGSGDLHLCDDCGLFSQPRKMAVFYFYFLVVVYGYSYSMRYKCSTCMRGEAWKMFFANFIFILGLPNAIIQLCRAYFGDVDTPGAKGLPNANAAAMSGKDPDKAIALYEKINQRSGGQGNAGIYYNMGIVMLTANQIDKAIDYFMTSLGLCSNYDPAYQQARHWLEEKGQADQVKALDKMFGVEQHTQETMPAPEVTRLAGEETAAPAAAPPPPPPPV